MPFHRVFVLLLHVPQCSFCKQLPLVLDTNDLDFHGFSGLLFDCFFPPNLELMVFWEIHEVA